MKQFVLFTLSCVMVTASLQTQQLKGVNVNKQGEPVPNSTIYIYEIAKGIAADNLGDSRPPLLRGVIPVNSVPSDRRVPGKVLLWEKTTRLSGWNFKYSFYLT